MKSGHRVRVYCIVSSTIGAKMYWHPVWLYGVISQSDKK